MYKKALSLLVVLTILTSSLGTVVFASGGTPAKVALPFTISDAISTPDGSALFLLSKSEKKVYKVDTLDFSMKSISFDRAPEALTYADGKLFVALCDREHGYTWWTEDQTGAFAVVDANDLAIDAIHEIKLDPCDIAVTKNGFICIPSGSGQWTDIHMYLKNGSSVSRQGGIYAGSRIDYNSSLDRIYAVDTGVSPRDIETYTLNEDGVITGNYDSPYHGDYSMGTTFHISPDGAYIFNSSGNVFTCRTDKADDMRFKTSLNKSWVNLAFNDDGTKFYTALNDKQIYAYDYATFEGTATYETQGYPQYIFVKGDTLTAISKETSSGSTYFIETVDLTAPKTTIKTTVTTKSLSYENGRAMLSVKSNAKTVFNGDVMYIADNIDNSVYAIDSTALTETKITFSNTPNSLYYDKGELFVGFGSSGVVVILDAKTFAVKDRLVLGTVFYDVASGKDGFIYIIEDFGSSAFSYVRSFSRTTGQQISNRIVYPRNGKFVPHPVYNMFYWADTWVSPQDINALTYENGVIKADYDSPYHGDYSIGSRIRISPDGASMFTSSGNVFRISNVQSEDMIYKNKFISFTDLMFDLPNNQMFASGIGVNLYAYDYSTYEQKGFVKTAFQVKEMTLNNGSIIALSSASNIFYLEVLNSDVVPVMPKKITVNKPDSVILANNSYINLTSTLWYNDGTSKSITNTAVYTSSNEAVATVNSSGRVQANGRGYAKINIEAESVTKSIYVYIDFDVDSISVEGYNIGFAPSKTSYRVDLYDITEVPAVTFKAPDGVVVNITPADKLPGVATLVVTDADGVFNKTYTINMELHKSTSISVNATNQLMNIGDTKQLKVNAKYTNGNILDVTSKSSFESSNPAVATVSETGLVSGVGSGTAKVTVNYGEFQTSFVVGVNIDVTSISVEGYDIDFSSFKTSYRIDLYDMTEVPAVTFEAPDGAVVNITPADKLPGVTTLTVTDAGGVFSKTYYINMELYRATQISINATNQLMNIGQTKQLQVNASYMNNSTADVTSKSSFESSNPAVATVSETGFISVVGFGTAKVTVNYGELQTSFDIEVLNPNTPTIKISTVQGLSKNIVEVKINIENNPGIVSMYLDINYDTSRLKLLNVIDSGLLQDNSFGKDLSANPYKINWDGSLLAENITENGLIATLQFEVLDNAPIGMADVSVTYGGNAILNYDLEPVPFEVQNGGIEVISYAPGDINGDGVIDQIDVALLRRYLAGWANITINEEPADVNDDGAIDQIDVALLRRYLAGWSGVLLK